MEMKSDSSDKSESCGEEESSGDEEAQEEQVISSTAEDQPPYYEPVQENIYLINKKKRINKEVRKMTCECYPEPDNPDYVCCDDDCLNRLLMIECNHRCPCGDLCTNKRFQQGCKIKVEVFKTDKKGWGVRTLEDIEENQFVIEYCGEVMNYRDFQSRAQRYDRQKRRHYYFMTLRADEIIDATFKGSLSRFINHSCEPNCVTQKWTVNGLLRIGFFTLDKIQAGEELTFDYQLQRYGKIAQTCYCEAPSCRGIIGGEKHTPLKNTIERIVTPSTSSPRRRKKRSIASDFEDLPLEDELERLIGDHHGMTVSDQALKLSRLMVRAEDMRQRIMLLKVLQNTTDQSCLKAFLRFQGLSLLWSWMVDAGAKPSRKLQSELLATLRYLPVTSRNQLDDSKVLKVVNKWAVKAAAEVEVPSSCSSQEDGNIDDADRTLTQEDVEAQTKTPDEKGGLDRQLSSTSSCSKEQSDEDTEVDKDSTEHKAVQEKVAEENQEKSPGELSEDDSKSTEDDQSLASDGDENVSSLANDLLKQWSTLKEIYRIPKKTPVKKKPEVVVATSSTGTPGATPSTEKEISTLVSQPDSSGKFEEPAANSRDETCIPPAALMSLDVPLMSKAEPSNAGASGNTTSTPGRGDEDFVSDEYEWKTVSSSAQIPTSTEEEVHHIPTICPDHQVFGYKQQMGSGMMEQGFGPEQDSHWGTRHRKQHHKSKWQQGFQQFPPQTGSPNIPGPAGPGYINPNIGMNPQPGRPWQDPQQHWHGGPQNRQQGLHYYGPQGAMHYQQGPFPGHQPANVPPPNIPMAPNFPRNVPPPTYPAQQMPFPPSQLPYHRLPQNMMAQVSNMLSDGSLSRYHGQMAELPPQQNMPHMLAPPPQGAFPSYNPTPSQPYPFEMAPQSQSPPNEQSEFGQTHSRAIPQDAVTTPESMDPESFMLSRESPSPVKTKPKPLPSNWKTATDPQGKIYFYHTITRQTQWDPPTVEFIPSPRAKYTADMDMETPSERDDEEPPHKKKKPTTPPGSPPRSPTLAYTTAPADTTENRCTVFTPPVQHLHDIDNPKERIKEAFRIKLSNVVVNSLNPFFKVDCKQGRITNVDDFKHLARKLTHGVMMKELQHVKSEESLKCTDSVKVKTKDFIRSYMKKFGAVYIRT